MVRKEGDLGGHKVSILKEKGGVFLCVLRRTWDRGGESKESLLVLALFQRREELEGGGWYWWPMRETTDLLKDGGRCSGDQQGEL